MAGLTISPTLFILICVFLLTVIVIAGIGSWLFSSDAVVDKRLREIQNYSAGGQGKKKQGKDGSFHVRWLDPIAKLALPDDKWKQSRMRIRLVRAGYRHAGALKVFFASKVVLAILFPLIAVMPLLAFPTLVTQREWGVFIIVGLALAGFFFPNFVLASKEEARRLHLSEVFPDVLDLLVVCVESGLSLDGAIKRVGDELRHASADMSDELLLVNLEIRAGRSRNDALKSLVERTDLEELRSLVSILIQAEHFGTSIADALREYADEMRDIRIQTAREKAAKLPVKMAIPILLFIFPALFLVILGPAMIQIYTQLIGRV